MFPFRLLRCRPAGVRRAIARSLRARKFWGGSTLPALPGGWELQKRVGLVRALLKETGGGGTQGRAATPFALFPLHPRFSCLRLKARQTNVHSPATFAKPLKLIAEADTDLIQPLTGSTSPCAYCKFTPFSSRASPASEKLRDSPVVDNCGRFLSPQRDKPSISCLPSFADCLPTVTCIRKTSTRHALGDLASFSTIAATFRIRRALVISAATIKRLVRRRRSDRCSTARA